MKHLIKYLYKRFVAEPYVPHNVFPMKKIRDLIDSNKGIKGTITVVKDEKGRFKWLNIETAEGFSSYEYFKYPFWKFNSKVEKKNLRLHDFAYQLKEEIRP